MAEMTDVLAIDPIMPSAEQLDFDRMVINYDRDADILLIHFDGPRPAVILDVDDHLSLGLDPVSHEVVGLQIEAYLLAAVFKRPQLMGLAQVAGIPDDEIDAIRGWMQPAVVAQGTIRSLLDALRPHTV